MATAATEAGSKEIIVGIRPEHLRFDTRGPISGEVGFVEKLGSDAYVHVDVAGRDGPPLMVRVDGRCPLARHTRVRVAVAEDVVHAFNPATGKRLVP